jgi:hypothetical protein
MECELQVRALQPALPVILITAAVQGLVLYGLQHAIKVHAWPATNLGWLLALYGIALFVPTTLELLAKHLKQHALWGVLTILTAVVGYFGWYHGSSVSDLWNHRFDVSGDDFPLAFIVFVWWFLVLPFVQNRFAADRWTLDYRLFFTHAWRNTLKLAEAALFTGLFWLILWLWMSLFRTLGIDFFRHLFIKPIFACPVTSVAFGCALCLIGSIDKIVSAVHEQLLGVLKWLAPVAGTLLILFTLALVVKLPGLVWSGTRSIGAEWLLWLVAVVVLFLNAAYRDGTVDRPYPLWISQTLRFSLPLTVVVSLASVYALIVRATDYGLTVGRVWAFIVAFTAVMYSIGYSVAAFRAGRWLQGIARINIAVALVMIALISAALTPLLSPYRLAANSQFDLILAGLPAVNRARSHGVGPYRYLRFHSGRYGQHRLQILAQLQGRPGADHIRKLAQHVLAERNSWQKLAVADVDKLVSGLAIYPAGRTLDPDLAKALAADWGKPKANIFPAPTSDDDIAGLYVDLSGSGEDEFVLLMNDGGAVYKHLPTGWHNVGYISSVGNAPPWKALLKDLQRGNIAATTPRWKDLLIGTQRFQVEAQ